MGSLGTEACERGGVLLSTASRSRGWAALERAEEMGPGGEKLSHPDSGWGCLLGRPRAPIQDLRQQLPSLWKQTLRAWIVWRLFPSVPHTHSEKPSASAQAGQGSDSRRWGQNLRSGRRTT